MKLQVKALLLAVYAMRSSVIKWKISNQKNCQVQYTARGNH